MLELSEAPVTRYARPDRTSTDEFRSFVARVEPRLRIALVAAYGAEEGRVALNDALSWAWEHWDRVQSMTNPSGYLYRVAQTAARRHRVRPLPMGQTPMTRRVEDDVVDPQLVDAVSRLPSQQRRVVLLVHAFGWSQQDVAELLGVAPSTVKQALDRGMRRLRKDFGGAR